MPLRAGTVVEIASSEIVPAAPGHVPRLEWPQRPPRWGRFFAAVVLPAPSSSSALFSAHAPFEFLGSFLAGGGLLHRHDGAEHDRRPIHPKAMPVILTAAKSMMCSCGRRGTRRKRYSGHYRTTT